MTLRRREFTGFSDAASHYPYEFLDVDRVSMVEVVGSITFVTLLLLGIGFSYIRAERRLDAVHRNDPTRSHHRHPQQGATR